MFRYSFRAPSATERDTWVKKIEAASRYYLDTENKRKRDKAVLARQSSAMVGRLFVVIAEGSNLVAKRDGKSDPYCEVAMGVQENRTKVCICLLYSVLQWSESFYFSI